MTKTVTAQSTQSPSLRTLYSVRSGFSIVWALSLGFLGAANPSIAALLLAIYPLWDASCAVFDARTNPEQAKGTQTVNAIISTVIGIAVIVALGRGVAETLIVYGIWAIVSGAIQLALAVGRRNGLTGQWPMMLSGGISMLAGVKFIATAHSPAAGLVSLAGYAGVGAIFYALSAFRLRMNASSA